MAQTKLVAFRCDAETLKKVDTYCSKRTYLTRSSMINQILNVVLSCADPDTLQKIVETWDAYSAGYEVTFRKQVAAQ